MGSWKIIAICLPRIFCMSLTGILAISYALSPMLKRMEPLTICPCGACTSCMSDRLVTDLPQPDSPTTPTVAPLGMENVTPSTALATPASVKK